MMILYLKPKHSPFEPKKSKLEYDIEAAEEKARLKALKTKDDLAVNIGEQFRAVRLSKHLTQQAFASLLGIRQSAVSRLEGGEFLPKLSVLKRYADKLNLNIDLTFTTGESDPLSH